MMDLKQFVLILFIEIFSLNLYSQELLSNGDFERKTAFPNSYGQSYLLKDWIEMSTGKWSPVTYFYGNGGIGYLPTMKQGGKQSPDSGYGFIGLGIGVDKANKIDSQYMETELLMPLEKDSIYNIVAYVSLADKINRALNYIPIAFSENEILRKNKKNISILSYYKLKSNTEYITNTREWVKVSTIYQAKGNEHFFIIGGRDIGLQTKKMPFKLSLTYFLTGKISYYFIDNISIVKLHNFKKIILVSQPTQAFIKEKIRTKIILNDIAFKFNSSQLKDTINAQLDTLANILIYTDSLKVNILGYTDNLGTEEYNKKLSLMRAKTVYEYLKNKQVPNEKMQCQGLGEANPIDNNKTEESRAKNRRVEITFNKN